VLFVRLQNVWVPRFLEENLYGNYMYDSRSLTITHGHCITYIGDSTGGTGPLLENKFLNFWGKVVI